MILDVNPLETVEKHFNVQLGQTILRWEWPSLPPQNLLTDPQHSFNTHVLMYVVYWCRSKMSGFEPYLLGKIRQEKVEKRWYEFKFEKKVFLWISEANAAYLHQRSSNNCSFIHSQSDLNTNSHIQHSHWSVTVYVKLPQHISSEMRDCCILRNRM
jgi:hypothetical protein